MRVQIPPPASLILSKMRPFLSFILINFRLAKDLIRCVDSILSSSMDFPFEIIVVNVPSGDGTEAFAAQHPEIRLLTAEKFSISGLRNIGLKASLGKYKLILDTDLVLAKDAVSNGIELMESEPSIAVAGFDLISEDGSSQFNGRRFPTPLTILARRTPLGRSILRWEIKRHLYEDADRDQDFEVDWVSGATMLMRGSALRDIGLLDERFVYGFEDVDWCYRAKRMGWKVFLSGRSKAVHRQHRRSARSLWFAYQHLRSAALFYQKHGFKSIFGRI
ncbi:MAG: hypothetical protein DRQ10_04980 [Candidatus Hydrothermota bacterium]|nr:MAG: hypothetical protein DRQ10_04980 [Candidatus Hydrothermae bacterium]